MSTSAPLAASRDADCRTYMCVHNVLLPTFFFHIQSSLSNAMHPNAMAITPSLKNIQVLVDR